jgi:integrase
MPPNVTEGFLPKNRRARRSFGAVKKMRSGSFQASYVDARGDRVLAPNTFATRRDADVWLAEVRRAISTGTLVNTRKTRMTLAEFGDEFWPTQVHLRRSTLVRDRGYFERYWLVELGTRPLGSITPRDIQDVVNGLSAAGLSPATVHKAGNVAHKVFAEALRRRYVPDNPVTGTRYPKIERSKRIVLGPEAIESLTETIDPDYRALVPFLCWSGLRIGEAFALRVADLDLEASPPRVKVERTLTDLGELVESAPKTEAGVRTVPLTANVAAEVAAHIERRGLGKGDHLFPARRGGPTRLNGWRKRVWNPATEAAQGVPEGFNVHQTRRTAVTLWLEAGVPLEVAVRWAGHADVSMILEIYATPRAEAELALIERIDASAQNDPAEVIAIASRR